MTFTTIIFLPFLKKQLEIKTKKRKVKMIQTALGKSPQCLLMGTL